MRLANKHRKARLTFVVFEFVNFGDVNSRKLRWRVSLPTKKGVEGSEEQWKLFVPSL